MAMSTRKSADEPFDVNHLWPLITHSSPSRTALVLSRVGSDPAVSGSVIEKAVRLSAAEGSRAGPDRPRHEPGDDRESGDDVDDDEGVDASTEHVEADDAAEQEVDGPDHRHPGEGPLEGLRLLHFGWERIQLL